MDEHTHQRAKKLIAQQHAEILSAEESNLLNAHLSECEFCAAEHRQLRESLSALRTMHLDLPPNLASRTQFRVRMRAEELREKEPAKKFIWICSLVERSATDRSMGRTFRQATRAAATTGMIFSTRAGQQEI